MNKKAPFLVLPFAISTWINFGSVAARSGVVTQAPLRAKTLRHSHLAKRFLIAPRVRKHDSRPPKVSELKWSPDGRWAAYYLTESRDTPNDWERVSLCCIRADGTQARRLYTGRGDGHEPEIVTWSPEGRHILFWEVFAHASSVNAEGSCLYDVSVFGGKIRLLTTPFWHGEGRDGLWDSGMMRKPHTLTFSPNGKYLLLVRGFGRFQTENKHLVRMTYPAGRQKWLTASNIAVGSPVWSQDSQQIAFLACPDRKEQLGSDEIEWRLAHRHLWVMDSDGLHQHPLTTDSHYQELDPRWLPDRRTIHFTRQENTPEGNGKRSVWEIHADGTGLRRIGNSTW